MGYTPENNPYIPGDPYSYDLKWMVKDIKHMEDQFGTLDAKVQSASDDADRAEREADRSRDEADRSDAEALVSEGYAKGTQDSEAVAPDSPYYENNSKYYSEEASASAQEAADYLADIGDHTAGAVADWLALHVDPDSGYVIDDTFTIQNAAADAKAVGDHAFLYRGSMSDLGYTAFSSCNEIGYYNFGQAYLSSITDKPTDIVNGGIILVYPNYAGGTRAQFILTEYGNQWMRISGGAWYHYNGDVNFIHRGNMSDLGYTTFSSCNDIGYFNFSQAYLSSITDKPADLTAGGVILVYPNYAGGIRAQIIISEYGNQWMRIGGASWYHYSGEVSFIYRGSMQDLGYTAFSSCNTDGYYNFGVAYLSSITDKPADLTAGGIIKTYTKYAGGTRAQIIISNDGNQWIRVGGAAWYHYIVAGTQSDTVWYAFGDSITRGTYCIDSETLGLTSDNYVYYAATRNGYKFTNYGEGASGYLHVGEFGTNAKGRIGAVDFTGCNLVTLAFGVNDWHYEMPIGTVDDLPSAGDTMASNMKWCIEKILTDNPKCKIVVLLPMNCSKYGGDFDSDWGLGTSLPTSGTLQHVIDVIKGIAEYYHLQYIDQSNTSVVNRFNINNCLLDGIHPDLPTYKQLGLNIAKQIQFA